MARIGFYGGTFNPIHNGHIGVCRQAVKQLKLDRLHLIPTFVPPHKSSKELASGKDRLAMCRLAVQDQPLVYVDDFELQKGGVSYSVETMRHMRSVYPEDTLYFIMGTDNYLTFTAWYRWREIGKLCTLAVASRELDDKEALYRQNRLLTREDIFTVFLDNTVQVISSTAIRDLLDDGEECSTIPAAVAEYIKQHDLYTDEGETL